MPEYIPSHAPGNEEALDKFTQDYLAAAEYLLDEEINRDDIIGWSKEAIDQARVGCEDFQEANKEDLETYRDKVGYAGGNDFWLTRNHHGAGFWDRGLDDVGDRLTDMAHPYGEVDAYLGDDGYLYFM